MVADSIASGSELLLADVIAARRANFVVGWDAVAGRATVPENFSPDLTEAGIWPLMGTVCPWSVTTAYLVVDWPDEAAPGATTPAVCTTVLNVPVRLRVDCPFGAGPVTVMVVGAAEAAPALLVVVVAPAAPPATGRKVKVRRATAAVASALGRVEVTGKALSISAWRTGGYAQVGKRLLAATAATTVTGTEVLLTIEQ
jgi:hypothetical protein